MTSNDRIEPVLQSWMARNAPPTPPDLLLRVLSEVDTMSQRTRTWPIGWLSATHLPVLATVTAVVAIIAVAAGLFFVNGSAPAPGANATPTATAINSGPVPSAATSKVSNGLSLEQTVFLGDAPKQLYALVKNATSGTASYYVVVTLAHGPQEVEAIGGVWDLPAGQRRAILLSPRAPLPDGALTSTLSARVLPVSPPNTGLDEAFPLGTPQLVGAGANSQPLTTTVRVAVRNASPTARRVTVNALLFRHGVLIGLMFGVTGRLAPSSSATVEMRGGYMLIGSDVMADSVEAYVALVE